MQRYAGSGLPPNPRVAVIANDALGNYAIQTSILAMVRRELQPSHLQAVSGSRAQEFLEASELMDSYWLLHGSEPTEAVKHLAASEPFDLVINLESTAMSKVVAGALAGSGHLCGPCVGQGGRGDLEYPDDRRGDLWRDKGWIAADLCERYPFLHSPFIAEIFARCSYLDGNIPPYDLPMKLPESPGTDVLISCSASLASKAWADKAWEALVEHLLPRYSIGLLGAPRKIQAGLYQGIEIEDRLVDMGVADLRGRYRLPEVVGAIAQAKQIITLDNGILHLAASTSTPTAGLFRHGIHRLWAPPAANVCVLEPGEGREVAEIPLASLLNCLEI
ncbi:MAG: hypothetical protein HONBIEJF_02926 [Fimbriimonadaceae bacterium]|nr:hypothetical protein [Fimbriimonadaceae bacterium]